MKQLKLVCTLFAVFMLFTSSVKNAYSWSPFSPDLVGEWVQIRDGIFPLIPGYITFYPDGKLKISGISNNSYKTSFSEVEITVHDMWGGSAKGTHKYSIDNGILSFDPGIYGMERFRRSK